MAVVQNTYTGNGTTVLYSLSFPYLDQADVKVSVNGTIVTNYIFATASSIQFLAAPANGASIRIYRETDIDDQITTIFPGSAIKAQDLNENFTQALYAVQESNFEADSATTTANTALTTANTAISTANAATSTANTALSNSTAAVSTANTASTNASNAVTTANTASANATTAVNTANAATVTANSAASTATTALNTANTASNNAATAVSTANTASTSASNAVTTANTALSTANTASSNASTAVTTANNAVSTANGAASTASTALTTANAAINAVASAVIYTPVANLTALAALTPSNGDYFELTDSTGAEGSALITGVTIGLVGAPGLTFRLRYDAPPGIFTFLGYFANDSETRYLKLSGGTLTGQLRGDDSTSASTPGFAFDGDPNTGIGRPGADELALITGGTARLTIDPSGNVAVGGGLTRAGNNVVTVGDTGTVTSTMIADGTIVDADVNASAAIAGSKISPNFGSQNVVTTGTISGASLTPTSTTVPTNGIYSVTTNAIGISTAGVNRQSIDSNGAVFSVPVSGNSFIPTSSTVPSNGVYLPAANSVAISTNGSGRLFVDSSGRVGIGTSSVASTLHIVDSSFAGNGTIRLGGGGAFPGFYSTIYQNSQSDGKLLFNSVAGSGSVHGHQFQVDGTAAVTIDASRRVGIGTASPGRALEIGTTGPAIKFNNGTNAWTIGTGAFVDGTDSFLIFEEGVGERLRVDNSGRLLVGTSSSSATVRAVFQDNSSSTGPGHVLLATSSSVPTSAEALGRLRFSAANHVESVQIEASRDGGTWTAGSSQPSKLTFSTTPDSASAPVERLRLDSTGNFGVFNGSGGSGSWTLGINSPQGAGTTSYFMLGNHSASNTQNTTGTNSFRVYTNGNIQNTNGSYTTISDAKLKENIVDAGSQWGDLKAIRIRNWNFKAETGHETHRQIGPIAQELEAVCPGLVFETPDRDEDGNETGEVTKGVNQSVLYMKAVKALQEAMERIEQLEAAVTALQQS